MDPQKDNENKETSLNDVSDRNPKKTLGEFDFIKDKPQLIFLIKKAERLSGVIHVLTSKMVHEPLRDKLRKECLVFLELAYKESLGGATSDLEESLARWISLIEVARTSLLISDMNSQILRGELLKLLPVIQILHGKERLAIAFDRAQLDVPFELPQETQELQKGQDAEGFYKKTESFVSTRDINKSQNGNGQKNNGHSTREVMILDVLRNKGEVSIRDITSIVRGVSSKTVQRDLNVLLSRGVLKKTGERRWSKYSLN